MDELDPQTAATLAELQRQGATVFGPSPTSMTGGPAVTPTPRPGPGMHVQIMIASRMVEGYGTTGAEAVRDAVDKLAGYDPGGRA